MAQPTSHSVHPPQGRWLGMPYDLRRPTWAKVRDRLWKPGGPLLAPKVWGVGWTFNLAHPGAGWVVAGLLAVGWMLAWVS